MTGQHVALLALQEIGLPGGFSTLHMECNTLFLSCWDWFSLEQPPDVAEQLCRLLSYAPASYRHAATSLHR